MHQPPHNMHRLPSTQSISEQSSSLTNHLGINTIDIETQMEGVAVVRIQIFYGLGHHCTYAVFIDVVHSETFYTVVGQC